jgi:hypothetical protein
MGYWILVITKRKKIIVILIVIIFITLFVSSALYFYYSDPYRDPQHIFELNYTYNDPQEFEAINASEHLDYRTIFNSSFFNEFGRYDYHTYIDSELIELYTKEYEKIDSDYHKYMIYKAEAVTLVNATVEYHVEYSKSTYYYYSNDGDTEYVGGYYEPEFIVVVKSEPERKYPLGDEFLFRDTEPFIVKNNSGEYQNLNWDKGFTLTDFNGYLVKMSFNYGYACGPLCGSGFDCYQIIILDSEYSPLYVFQIDSGWIS